MCKLATYCTVCVFTVMRVSFVQSVWLSHIVRCTSTCCVEVVSFYAKSTYVLTLT